MAETREKRTRGRALLFALALALLIAAAGAAAWLLTTVRIGEHRYRRAEIVDARAETLDCAAYEAAARALPGAELRWSVPIGDERFDSFSEELTLAALPEDQVERLGCFPKLKAVDAAGCADYAALAAAAKAYPALQIRWGIPTAQGEVDGNAESLAVTALSPEQLRELIPLLPWLERADLMAAAYGEEEIDRLIADFPAVRFRYPVTVWGETAPSDTAALALRGGGDREELRRALPDEVVFITPNFVPSAVPEGLAVVSKTSFAIGEFTARYEPEYATPPPWVKIVPAMELYINGWMQYALGVK